VLGSGGLAGAHACPLASRMEFNHRRANSVLPPTFKISACVYPVSREIDLRFPVFVLTSLFVFLCLEPASIFHQLDEIQHEDPLD
jgi:hypothetical protein